MVLAAVLPVPVAEGDSLDVSGEPSDVVDPGGCVVGGRGIGVPGLRRGRDGERETDESRGSPTHYCKPIKC